MFLHWRPDPERPGTFRLSVEESRREPGKKPRRVVLVYLGSIDVGEIAKQPIGMLDFWSSAEFKLWKAVLRGRLKESQVEAMKALVEASVPRWDWQTGELTGKLAIPEHSVERAKRAVAGEAGRKVRRQAEFQEWLDANPEFKALGEQIREQAAGLGPFLKMGLRGFR
jgi:hypothetical protein